MRRAAHAITQLYDTMLAPTGLKITQLSLLRAVARHESVSITALADAVYLDRTTLGRNLHVLERDGLVALTPGTDQRERVVHLTDQGRAALEAAAPLWEQAQQTISETLGAEQIATLTALLSKVAAVTPPLS
jgi:DNA-binding MarR family transcriptional regulator